MTSISGASSYTSGVTPISQDQDQKQELAKLAALLNSLQGQVGETKETDDAKGGGLGDSMAQMAYALQMLQVLITKFGQQQAQNDQTLSQTQVTAAHQQLEKVLQQIKKVEDEERKAEKAGFWKSFAEIFSSVVIDVVAIVTCQPELAVISTAMLVCSITGAFDKLTTQIAKLLSDMGLGDEAAKIVAAVLVTVLVIAATAGVAPSASVETAADDVGEGASTGAAAVTTEGEAGGSVISKVATKLKSVFNKINLFNRLSTRTNLMILNGMQVASETGLISNVGGAIASAAHMSDKDKQELELILGIVAMVAQLLISLGAGAAMMGQASANAGARTATGVMGRVLAGLKTLAQTSRFLEVTNSLLLLSRLTSTAMAVVQGVNTIEQGEGQKKLASLQAGYDLLTTVTHMTTEQTKEDQKYMASTLQAHGLSASELSRLVEGTAAFSKELGA